MFNSSFELTAAEHFQHRLFPLSCCPEFVLQVAFQQFHALFQKLQLLDGGVLSGLFRAGLNAALQHGNAVLQLLEVDRAAPDRLAGSARFYRKYLCLPVGKQFRVGMDGFARRFKRRCGCLAPGLSTNGLLRIGTSIIPVEFE